MHSVKSVRMLKLADLCIKSFLYIGFPAAYAFWTLVGSIARIEGISMQPTFNSNPFKSDWVYINRWKKYQILPGDVVILLSPRNPKERIIKRVVAVKGIKITNYPEPRINPIPPGHIWVEGDNPGKSVDSNEYGPVPLGLVVGKVKWIVWPPNRVQAVESKLTEMSALEAGIAHFPRA